MRIANFLSLPHELHQQIYELLLPPPQPTKKDIKLRDISTFASLTVNKRIYNIYYTNNILSLPSIQNLFSNDELTLANISTNLGEKYLTLKFILDTYKQKLQPYIKIPQELFNIFDDVLDKLRIPISQQIINLNSKPYYKENDTSIIKALVILSANNTTVEQFNIIKDYPRNTIYFLSKFCNTSQGANFLAQNFNEFNKIVTNNNMKINFLSMLIDSSPEGAEFLFQHFGEVKSYSNIKILSLAILCLTPKGAEYLSKYPDKVMSQSEDELLILISTKR